MKRLIAVVCLISTFAFGEQFVTESARQIPVAAEVDVVVAGGSSGGVAAAVKAAENGASVFLISSRTYLGQDICGTMRLWPEGTPDTPLARAVYKRGKPTVIRSGHPFTYTANVESAAKHKDKRGIMLADGKSSSAARESVQYDTNVTITADLGNVQEIKNTRLLVYQRPNNFAVQSVAVSASEDGKDWSEPVKVLNPALGGGQFEDQALEIPCPLNRKARYLKIRAAKAPKSQRILLAEIIIETADSDVLGEIPAEPPTPMQVKRELENALRKAGVKFLYGCYPTDVLRDADGELAGIVMVNRSGRQAIVAKTIIDATGHSTVARLAGAEFTPSPGQQEFKRIVIGGQITKDFMPIRKLGMVKNADATEYTLSLPVRDGSFAAFAEADQKARDLTWQNGQALASEAIFPVSPPRMIGKINNLYVLEPMKPLDAMKAGAKVGAKAARAKDFPTPGNVTVAGTRVKPVTAGDIGESLQSIRGLKPVDGAFVQSLERSIPIIGKYDTVIIGGGTGGAPAGIGAARQGAKTLVVEYLHGLGGVGTIGMISKYYHGNRVGFTTEIDKAVKTMPNQKKRKNKGWDIEDKMEWYRKELRKAGADIWFRSMGCGAFVENGRVKGVVVATPYGRGVVLCNTVIDSTGNSDIAVAAGANYRLVDAEQFAMQGTGLSSRGLGQGYNNSDWSYVNDSDVVDRTRMHVVAKNKFKGAFDISPLILSRERRSIVGDYTLSPLDILNNRTFHDSIERAKSDFDSHGYTTHPLLKLWFKGRTDMYAYVPYRCLLPRGLDGILVVGLGASQHRDALPIVRMQPDIQNQGYAAGVASAMAANSGTTIRNIDIRALQRHLVDIGNLSGEVLQQQDSPHASRADVEKAVKELDEEFDTAAVILDAAKEDSLPVLRRAYKSAEAPNQKLLYARVLGILGDETGLQTLIDAVRASEWDQGWAFTGMGNRHSGYSKMDSMIVALGKIGNKAAVPVIRLRAGELTPQSDFSHFRAVALGLEAIGDPSAAATLAGLLKLPGTQGHAFPEMDKALELTPVDQRDNSTRENSLRELILARALYRCGDQNGLGEKILREYTNDLRGLYALHARQVLGLENPLVEKEQ